MGISANKCTNEPGKSIRIPLNPELYLSRNQRPYNLKARTRIWISPLVITGVVLILASSCKKKDDSNIPSPAGITVTDIDGNVYHTVTIGTQIWIAENLKTTKYRNGDPIPNVPDSAQWNNLTTGAYCWVSNDMANRETYGALYNYYAIEDNRNIAPDGYHVPTDEEWTVLIDYLGGDSIAGSKMKEPGTKHWYWPNDDATNSSGFTALPAGWFHYSPQYSGPRIYAHFWSSTPVDSLTAWYRTLSYSWTGVYRSWLWKIDGLSVRCIKN